MPYLASKVGGMLSFMHYNTIVYTRVSIDLLV